jgi:hypothetical protein
MHVQRGARLGQSTPTDRTSAGFRFILVSPTVHGRRHTQQGTPAVVVLGDSFDTDTNTTALSHKFFYGDGGGRREERVDLPGPSLRRRPAFAVKHPIPSRKVKQSNQPIKPQKQTSVVKTTYQIPPGPTLVPRIVKSRGPQPHPAPDRVQNLPGRVGHVNP